MYVTLPDFFSDGSATPGAWRAAHTACRRSVAQVARHALAALEEIRQKRYVLSSGDEELVASVGHLSHLSATASLQPVACARKGLYEQPIRHRVLLGSRL